MTYPPSFPNMVLEGILEASHRTVIGTLEFTQFPAPLI